MTTSLTYIVPNFIYYMLTLLICTTVAEYYRFKKPFCDDTVEMGILIEVINYWFRKNGLV